MFKIIIFNCNLGPKCSDEEYAALFKMKPKDSKIEVQSSKYNEYDRMHFLTGVSAASMETVHILNKKSSDFKFKFQSLIHDLIRIRNKILRVQRNYKKQDCPDKYGIKAENIVKFMEYTQRYEHDPEYSIYKVYQIPLRKVSKPIEEVDSDSNSIEITDSEQDHENNFQRDGQLS